MLRSKLAEMAARQRRPEHAVAVDVAAARPVAGQRRLVDFGRARCASDRRPGSTRTTQPGYPSDGAPDRAVDRVHGDRVEASDDALVLGRVDRLVGLDIVVALAVAVGVEDERRPALRFLLVAGLLEHLAIEPADDAGACRRRRWSTACCWRRSAKFRWWVGKQVLISVNLPVAGSYIESWRLASCEREHLARTDGPIPSCRSPGLPAGGRAR